MRGLLYLLLLAGLSGWPSLSADTVLSEFMAINDTVLNDEDGDASDWIEIRNDGPVTVDLAGWHLTDDVTLPTKWTFPTTLLDPGAHLIVFASEKDRRVTGSELHTNFKLSSEGEYLALMRPDGTTPATAFSPAYPPQFVDISYGSSVASLEEVLVTEGHPAKAFVPNAAYDGVVGTTWRNNTPGFDESGWISGALGVGYERSNGYESDIGLDVEAALYNLNGSVYIRIPFPAVSDPANVVELTLRMKYDDGFAAFLNGVPVAAANAPASLDWNSLATGSHGDDAAQIFVDYDISAYSTNLSATTNLLAIHGLNMALTSSDLLQLPELKVRFQDPQTTASTGFFELATPGSLNPSLSHQGVVEDTHFVVGRGIFTNAFTETFTCTEPGATLIHTLDGSAPSLTNGVITLPPNPTTAPTGTVTIATTTTLRVRAVKEDFLPTNVDTESYIFPNDVIYQTGDGYPLPPHPDKSDWDYEMDPNIVNDPRFPDVAADLLTLPTLSVVMDRDDLWGVDGVYANPDGYGFDWEAPCSVEYIRPDGGPGFQEDGGFRLHGSGSRRTSRPWSKKSMRIAFRKMYGEAKLDFPLFGGRGAQRLDNIVLRGNYFDSWTVHVDGSAEGIARSNAMVLRDEYGRQTHQDMGAWPVLQGGWAHVYLNGMYWGVYNIHERPDQHFAEDRFGGGSDDYDVLKQQGPEVVNGDLVAWNQLMATIEGDMTDPAVYASVREQMDVDAFADYLLMNFYGGNNDWPHNNWYAIRHRPSNAPFTFVAWDVEHYIFLKNDFGPINTSTAESPGILWARLRLNPEFRLYFADRIHKHMFNDGALTPEKCTERFMGIVDTVLAGMNGEAARWGDALAEPPYNTADHYEAVVADKVNNYFPIRTSVVFNNLVASGAYPATAAPEFSQHGGQVPVDYLLTLTNPATTTTTQGPVAQGWTGTGTGTGVDAEAVVDEGTHAWRINDDAGNLNPVYNSSLSASNLAQMYQAGWEFEMVVRAVRDAGTGAGFCGWGVSPGNDPGWGLSNQERVGFLIERNALDDAFQVSPEHGGTIILAPGSATNFHTLRCVGVPSSSQYEFFVDDVSQGVFDITDGASNNNYDDRVRFGSGSTGGTGREAYWHRVYLESGGDVLAGYDANLTTSGGPGGTIYYTTNGTDPRLTGGAVSPDAVDGTSLVISSPTQVKARILNGDEWSALTEAVFVTAPHPVPGSIVVSEFHYHPAPPTPAEELAGFLNDDDFEYLELLNVSTNAVDLSGVSLADAIRIDLATLADPNDRLLEPGERLLLAANAEAMAERYGTTARVAAVYDGKLNNDGETISVLLASAPLLSFTYNDVPPWPESPDGDGPSMVLRSPDDSPDLNDPYAWRPSAFFGGTPGADTPPEPAYPEHPEGDDNTNGIPDLIDYAIVQPLHWSVYPTTGTGTVAQLSYSAYALADQVRASVGISTNLVDWVDLPATHLVSEVHHNDGTLTYGIQPGGLVATNNTLFLRLQLSP